MAVDAKEKSVPVALMIVGALILIVRGLTAGASAGATIAYLGVSATIGVVLMVIAAMITAKLIGASFGDFGSATLKFGGIYLTSMAIGSLLPFGGGLIVFFISLGLIMWLFELEMYQAVTFAVIMWVVNLVVGLLLAGIVRA